jgi:uncharacterized protein (DUF1330 family)
VSAYLLTVARVTRVDDQFRRYAERTAELVARFGGTYAIRGPALEVLEGEWLDARSVVVSKFPSAAEARAFFDSPEYQALKVLRTGTGTYDIALFPGLD